MENETFLELIGQAFSSHHAGALGIAAIITQIIVAGLKAPLFKDRFKKLAGKWKLLIVSGISLLSGILTLLASGADWGDIIKDALILTTAQVFVHQIYSQFKK